MKKAIIGIVESRAHAEAVVESLRNVGISVNDISVLFPDKRGTQDFAHEHSTKAPEGAIAGVSTGGLLGGTLGLLAGIGALAIPGLGPFIAAGPLMAALSGAAAGATLGGLTGSSLRALTAASRRSGSKPRCMTVRSAAATSCSPCTSRARRPSAPWKTSSSVTVPATWVRPTRPRCRASAARKRAERRTYPQ